jgi:hypothetical protein
MDKAVDFYNSVERDFHRAGYLLGIYGSVTKGGGRDLDLLAIPDRLCPHTPDMLESILSAKGFRPCDPEPYRGIMKTWSRVFSSSEGYIVDLRVSLPAISPEEAYISMRLRF